MKKKRPIIWTVMILWILPATAVSDIYKFIDSEGVVHFTNVPTSSNYRLYIREKPQALFKKSTETDAFDRHILAAQNRHGVDFSLIKAVISVESNFNPRAVSRKGAKGLMQIMPFNFKALAVEDPFDPSQNIMGGALYLSRLFKRYNNRLPLVLAAYNAGPDAVDRYDRIPPYEETQRYVQKVMEAYSRFKNS